MLDQYRVYPERCDLQSHHDAAANAQGKWAYRTVGVCVVAHSELESWDWMGTRAERERENERARKRGSARTRERARAIQRESGARERERERAPDRIFQCAFRVH